MQYLFSTFRWLFFFHQQINWLYMGLVIIILLIVTNPALALGSKLSATSGVGDLNTKINQNASTFEITGGEQQGSNLFHSFHHFNLNAGETAKFLNQSNASISNLFSRVTGGLSTIDGTIDTMNFPNANLFLLNPAGVKFGKNARLNVDGSFHVSTADYVKFDDNSKFYTDPAGQSGALTVAAPAAFGFLTTGKGKISVDGSVLKVPESKSLSLLGTLEFSFPFFPLPIPVLTQKIHVSSGVLSAPAGHLVIAQIEPGLNAEYAIDNNLLGLSNKIPGAPDIPSVANNDVYIRAGQFVLYGAEIGKVGSNMRVDAVNVKVLNGGRMTANSTRMGDAPGNIILNAADTIIIKGRSGTRKSRITSTLQDPVLPTKAGKVEFFASNKVIIDDGLVSVSAAERNANNAEGGDIIVKTGRLELLNGGQLRTEALGAKAGGQIVIEAEEVDISGSGFERSGLISLTNGKGQAGDLIVNTNTFQLSDHASINTNTEGSGNAGSIFINAKKIMITENARLTASTLASGKGGNIDVSTVNLKLKKDGRISAESAGQNSGVSGSIAIRADDIFRLSSGGNISVKTDAANAGSIDINVGNLLHIQDNSAITTSVAGGKGMGGNITIDPIFVILEDGSKIVANAEQGNGGNILIETDFFFKSPRSQINASSELGIDGTVEIDTPDGDIIPGVIQLPGSFSAETFINTPCAARTSLDSSFVVNVHKGSPLMPDSLLPSNFSNVVLKNKSNKNTQSELSDSLNIAASKAKGLILKCY